MEKNSLLKLKKAQIGDMIFVLVTITSIALTMLVALHVYDKIGSSFEESSLSTNESTQAYNDMGGAFNLFDKAYAFIVIGLIIAMLISSYFIPSHPIFIVINIFGFLILVFLGAVFSNLYVDFVNQPGFNATLFESTYGTTAFIVTKLPWIGAIITFLGTIIMFAKGSQE